MLLETSILKMSARYFENVGPDISKYRARYFKLLHRVWQLTGMSRYSPDIGPDIHYIGPAEAPSPSHFRQPQALEADSERPGTLGTDRRRHGARAADVTVTVTR